MESVADYTHNESSKQFLMRWFNDSGEIFGGKKVSDKGKFILTIMSRDLYKQKRVTMTKIFIDRFL